MVGDRALNIFCPAVYSFMCGMSLLDIIVSSGKVPDEIIRDFLEKVCLHVIFSSTHITSNNMKALIQKRKTLGAELPIHKHSLARLRAVYDDDPLPTLNAIW